MTRVVRVPLKQLTPENVEGFGEVIRSLDEVEPVVREGEMVTERMEMLRKGDELYFANLAVGDEGVVATLVEGAAHVSHVNFHSDATQAFIGADRKPTVFLLAKPTNNLRPEDFVAFYSDGSLGMSMLPDVWHTSPLPVEGSQSYEKHAGQGLPPCDRRARFSRRGRGVGGAAPRTGAPVGGKSVQRCARLRRCRAERAAVSVAVAFLGSLAGSAEASPRPQSPQAGETVLHATRVAEAPRLDGVLDERIWGPGGALRPVPSAGAENRSAGERTNRGADPVYRHQSVLRRTRLPARSGHDSR